MTTEIYSTDILDREAFWRDELMQVGESFLFGCATGFYANWLNTSGAPREREGISEGHAYSIMDAKEIKGQRLLKLRNPWGKKEWTGRWSDGSPEWTPEWMQLLDHKFGNDGIFWISYEDLLRKYQHFDRTRIFGPEWNVTQCWTSVSVSWSAEYHSTKFSLTLEEKAPVVIVLAQLDDTYFGGLEGGYGFDLQFRLESDDKEDQDDYIVRSNGNYAMARSVSTDIELEAGTYSVLMRITATRHTDREHVEDVLPVYAATRREKLIQMGLSYDLAHAKGVTVETEADRKERKERNKVRRAKEREKMKERMKAQAEKHWKKEKERHKREKERRMRNRRRRERKQRADTTLEEDGGRRFVQMQDNLDGVGPDEPGSVEVQTAEGPETENGKVENGQEQQASTSEVLRIKSFGGEDIIVNRSPDKTEDSASQAPTTGKPVDHVSADDVVEPLEDVIKVADAEDAANRPEAPLPRLDTASNPSSESQAQGEEKPPTPIVQVNGVNTITDVKPLPSLPPRSRPEAEIPPSNGDVNGRSRRHMPRRSDTLDTTAAMVGIGSGAASEDMGDDDNDEMRELDIQTQENRLLDGDDARANDNDAVSDTDSFPPFDWNSELDMPSELSSSDSEASSFSPRGRLPPGLFRRGRRRRSRGRVVSPPPPLPPSGGVEINLSGKIGEDADGPEEPWNAVCVLGLRVYSTLKGEGVKLRVVRPSESLSDTEDEAAGKGRKGRRTAAGGEGGQNANNKDRDGARGPSEVLDPDDMAKGAVAVVPESTGAEVEGEQKQVKAGDEMKLGNTSVPVTPGTRGRGRRDRQLARR